MRRSFGLLKRVKDVELLCSRNESLVGSPTRKDPVQKIP